MRAVTGVRPVIGPVSSQGAVSVGPPVLSLVDVVAVMATVSIPVVTRYRANDDVAAQPDHLVGRDGTELAFEPPLKVIARTCLLWQRHRKQGAEGEG